MAMLGVEEDANFNFWRCTSKQELILADSFNSI